MCSPSGLSKHTHTQTRTKQALPSLRVAISGAVDNSQFFHYLDLQQGFSLGVQPLERRKEFALQMSRIKIKIAR